MQAGRMKTRLRILRPITTEGELGGESLEWVETATVHAERVKQTGSNTLIVGEHFPDYRTEFNIRDAHEVEENWRVEQLGGYLYNVANVIPNIDRGMKTLVCDRVNP